MRPFCVTLTDTPAIVSVADLAALSVFAAIDSVTVPAPDPPPVIVSHDGAPDAVQLHPPCVVTLTLALLADERTDRPAGATE